MINDNITNEEKAKLTVNALVTFSEELVKLQEQFLKSHKAINRDIQYLKSAMYLTNGVCVLLAVIIALIFVGIGMGIL